MINSKLFTNYLYMKNSLRTIYILLFTASLFSCENNDFSDNRDIQYLKSISSKNSQTKFYYNNDGKLIEITTEIRNSLKDITFNRLSFNYDGNDEQIEYVENDFIYNGKNKSIKIYFNHIDDKLSNLFDSGKDIYDNTFKFDEKGRIIESKFKKERPAVKYKYDNSNNIIEIEASPTKTDIYGDFEYDFNKNAYSSIPATIKFFLGYNTGENNIVKNRRKHSGYSNRYEYNHWQYPKLCYKTYHTITNGKTIQTEIDTIQYEYY